MNAPCCDECGVLMFEGDLHDCLLCGVSAQAVYLTYKDGKLEANFRLPEGSLVSGVLLEAGRLGSDGTIFTEDALKALTGRYMSDETGSKEVCRDDGGDVG